MKNKSSLDKSLKNEIVVGSYIVYGHNLGRCAGLKFGKVIKIDNPPSDKNVFRYHVIGVDDDWAFRNPELSKRGMLLYENRMMVLPFTMLPEYAQKLLVDVQ